jgi:TonB family protein
VRQILAITGALLSRAMAGPAGAQDPPRGGAPPSAGVCVLLNDVGHVLDARLAETSGDPQLDSEAVQLARQLQWNPPFPKAGWLGVRVTMGEIPPGPPNGLGPPHCSAASDVGKGQPL